MCSVVSRCWVLRLMEAWVMTTPYIGLCTPTSRYICMDPVLLFWSPVYTYNVPCVMASYPIHSTISRLPAVCVWITIVCVCVYVYCSTNSHRMKPRRGHSIRPDSTDSYLCWSLYTNHHSVSPSPSLLPSLSPCAVTRACRTTHMCSRHNAFTEQNT